MIKIDVHQHVWSEPLLSALAARRELPFVMREAGLEVLYLAAERPYVLDRDEEGMATRARRLAQDGLDAAIIAPSGPLGIEWLPRASALALIDAYHEGALAAGDDFGAWGAVPLARAEPADVDRALDAGCIGIALPAGALARAEELIRVRPLLERLEERGAPLFVHPGPGRLTRAAAGSLRDPLWWPALTAYVAQMQAAWLMFTSAGRRTHPRLRVIFAMLAGLAPLQAERLRARGAATSCLEDPLLFYETSSYGPRMLAALGSLVGREQILYGSDRPVVDPSELDMPAALEWEPVLAASVRAFAGATLPSAHGALAAAAGSRGARP
jgi:predicted TIM-barrel fold metal-dependent hydrolase